MSDSNIIAINITSSIFFGLLSFVILILLLFCCCTQCITKKQQKTTNSIDIRGNKNKFSINKYVSNKDQDVIEFAKYNNLPINTNIKKDKKYFVFKFDNLSKLTKQNYKLNKNTDEFDNLTKFVNLVLKVGDKNKDEVILIISSPGGYAFEFEEAYSQFSRLKTNGFKTIALIEKMCASGGYMLACACDKIICSETSMIGSVGVIGQTINYKELADKLGIKFFRFTTGKYKGGFPNSTEYTDEDIELTKEEINKTLEQFKSIVIKARPNIDIEKILTAKVWYGKEALELGLVDELKICDDYIIEIEKDNDIYYVNPETKKENILESITELFENKLNIGDFFTKFSNVNYKYLSKY